MKQKKHEYQIPLAEYVAAFVREQASNYSEREAVETAKTLHRGAVKHALYFSRRVSKAVMADYPDLWRPYMDKAGAK